MTLRAICTVDPSHEVWVTKWIKGKPYATMAMRRLMQTIGDNQKYGEITIEVTHCPCGAPIIVIDECPRNAECWGSASPQCEGEYENCPIYQGEIEGKPKEQPKEEK